MIGVKSTRGRGPEPEGAERYEIRNDGTRSRLPAAIGLMLGGVAAYVYQLIFSTGLSESAAASEARPHPAAGDAPGRARPVPAAETPDGAEKPAAAGTGDEGTGHDPAAAPARHHTALVIGSYDPARSWWKAQGAPKLIAAGSHHAPASNTDAAPPPVHAFAGRPDDGAPSGASKLSAAAPHPPAAATGKAATDGTRTGPAAPAPAANRAPRVSGPVFLEDATVCAAILISLDSLLRNAGDPDGDALSVANLTATSGTLTPVDGGWILTPAEDLLGVVVLSYEVTDGTDTVVATAHLSVVPNPVEGTGENDDLAGTDCTDQIVGYAGDDVLAGLGGADILDGGAGNDVLQGGDGNDTLFGGAGDDILYGGNGDDILYGGAGNDQLFGGAGNDLIFGGAGDDRLSDGAGSDIVFGDAGDDTVVAALDGASDSFFGGAGTDTLDLTATAEGVTVDLAAGTASGAEIGTDSVSDFEVVKGGAGDDTFVAGAFAACFEGGAGDDTFRFDSAVTSRAAPGSVFEITDFAVGDHIRIDAYDLFEAPPPQDATGAEDYFKAAEDESQSAIRYRHDSYDGLDDTAIEVDQDHDNAFETTIHVQGTHYFILSETA